MRGGLEIGERWVRDGSELGCEVGEKWVRYGR